MADLKFLGGQKQHLVFPSQRHIFAFTNPPAKPATMDFPSGENPHAQAGLVRSLTNRRSLPVAVSHNTTAFSSEVLRIVYPPGGKTHSLTTSERPTVNSGN
jgi:hypothetical protein